MAIADQCASQFMLKLKKLKKPKLLIANSFLYLEKVVNIQKCALLGELFYFVDLRFLFVNVRDFVTRLLVIRFPPVNTILEVKMDTPRAPRQEKDSSGETGETSCYTNPGFCFIFSITCHTAMGKVETD